jgi:hypothetical protein
MRRFVFHCLVSLILLAIASQAQAPVPQALMEAQNVFLTLDRESEMRDLDEIAKELGKWGRFRLVDAPEKSDIILRLEERPGIGAFGLVAYAPAKPDLLLWSEQAKRSSRKALAKRLVKSLRERLEPKKKR